MHDRPTNDVAGAIPPAPARATVAVERSAATVVPLDRRPVAHCTCCGRSYSAGAWVCLTPAAAHGGRMDSGIDGIELNLRACVCGSHISAAVRSGAYLLHSEYEALAAADSAAREVA